MSLKPWYKHRWPWILMAGPAIVVVAALTTAWIAVKSNDGLVDDNYYKVGLAVNQELKQRQLAAELNISATLRLVNQGHEIQLILEGLPKDALPDALQLRLVHPTRTGEDQSINLVRQGAIFQGPIAGSLGSGHWHVVIEDHLAGWRIDGAWDFQSQSAIIIHARAH